MKTKIKPIKKNFVKNLVLIGGATRSGKVMLAPIVSSLERSENIRLDHLTEQITMLHSLGLISNDVAMYLLRYSINFMLYEIFIGRNANFRPSDYTSIWNTRQPEIYFKRLFLEEGEAVFKQIDKDNPIFVLMFHNALWYADILFKAFPTLKILHMRRHPIDMVYSWYRKGYGADFCEKPHNALLTIEWKSEIIPFYAIGWEEEYKKLKEMDRIIHMILRIQEMNDKSLDSLSEGNRKKIMIISFEKMATNPKPILSKICSFLDTKETLYTKVVLERERCPRTISTEERKMKRDRIRELASNKAFKLLMEIGKKYGSQEV